MPRQTAALGRDLARRTAEAAASLGARRFLPKLWEKDPGLWDGEPAMREAIRNRLGWLSIVPVMARQAESIRRLAAEIRQAGFTHGLLLGMGGSSLFADVCRATFGVAKGAVDLAVLDTTDPAAILAHQRRCPPERLCAVVSSKSGSTIEVSTLAKYFYDAFTPLGNPGAHCLAITDCDTPLETQAEALRFRRVLTHGTGTGADVGGRFSALTYFGLVPAALLGVDIARLLQRAEAALFACGPGAALDANPAVQLGAALAASAQAGRDKLTLLCAPAVAGFGTWLEQLVAESTGKQGQGIVPIHGEPRLDPAAYGSDRVFVELQLAAAPDAALAAHAQALAAAGHPVIRMQWDDRYDLGGDVVTWCLATTIAGSLLGVNPFDEPNVQESKDRTKALLAQHAKTRRLPEDSLACSEQGIGLFGGGPAGSLAQCLAAFFQRRKPGDYAAVLSFLPRTPSLDEAVQAFREWLGGRLGCATMLQFGPRYLHSTGQLYKGGPDNGLFLLLTAEDAEDVPIPGEPYSFGVLKRAQALGDFQAMREKGRRILRLDLGRDPGPAMARLLAAVDAAASAGL